MTLTESTLDSLPEAVSCSTHVHETYHKNEIPTLSSEALERTSVSGGRNRIDARGKDIVCARCGSAVTGPRHSNANDNQKETVALAA